MSTSSDEQFYGLAIKAAAGRCTAAEKAELDAILAAEPSRASEHELVKADTAFALKIVPRIYEELVEVPPLPEEYRQRFLKRAAEVFGPPQATTAAPKELSAKEMEALVLKILAERPMDGFDLATSLEKARIKPKAGGEGTWYGLLQSLESDGYLEGRWRERGSRMVKSYHVTEKGTGRLQKNKAASSLLESLSRAALSFDTSQG